MGRRRLSLQTADFRRKPTETADFCRNPSVPFDLSLLSPPYDHQIPGLQERISDFSNVGFLSHRFSYFITRRQKPGTSAAKPALSEDKELKNQTSTSQKADTPARKCSQTLQEFLSHAAYHWMPRNSQELPCIPSSLEKIRNERIPCNMPALHSGLISPLRAQTPRPPRCHPYSSRKCFDHVHVLKGGLLNFWRS